MREHIIVADYIKADERQVTDPPNNNKDYTWQTQMNNGYKGKPRKPGEVTPEGTFTKSPSEIARLLKMNSKDYGQASRKLNSYINRSGRNLQGADKNRLYDAKEHLKNNYSIQDQQKKPEGQNQQQAKLTTAIAEQPIYALPPGHNKDDGAVDLLKVIPDNREKFVEQDPQMKSYPKLNASARLKASVGTSSSNKKVKAGVLNSEQDPGAPRMSSVTNVAPGAPGAPGTPKKSVADATFDSLDTKFEESRTPQRSAYANVRSMLAVAMKVLADGEKWSSEVKTKKHPPEGLFKSGSGDEIAKWLKRSHKDLKGATSAGNFYLNRGGKNISPERRKAVEHALSILPSMYKN